MPINYTVNQGDCMSSIAFQFGFLPSTIWKNPANANLKQLRKDPNILMPGDVVVIPDKAPREESCSTDARHEFVLKSVPAICRLQIFDGTKPRANQKYLLVVDGKILEGLTDSDGVLVQNIKPDASKGHLTIGPDIFEADLDFGAIDPITELSGIRARLNNLGYDCGPSDDPPNDKLQRVLLMFQSQLGLERTGEPDQATIKKLEEIHDRISDFPPDYPPEPNEGPADDE